MMSTPARIDAQLAVTECRAAIALARSDHQVDVAQDALASPLVFASGKEKATKRLASALDAREQAAKRLASVRANALTLAKPTPVALSEWQDLQVGPQEATESWLVRALPPSEGMQADGLSLDTVWVDSLVQQAPRLAEIMSSCQRFELIGPGVALEGLRNGLFELVPAKAGGVLGAVRAVGGTRIEHQARFAAVSAISAVSPGLAVSVASAVLGQMHMVEIRKSLDRIESGIRALHQNELSRIVGDVHGGIRSLQEVLSEIGSGQAFDDPIRQRLDRLGDELNKACVELSDRVARASSRANLPKPNIAALNTYFESNRLYERHDARLLLDARSAVAMIKRLRLEQQRKAGSRLQVYQDQFDQAIASLRAFETEVAFSTKLHGVCRKALDEEHSSSIRLRSSHTKQLSEHLRDDRIEFALLTRTFHQRLAALDRGPEARVLRLDLSGSQPRATVALTESDAWLVGDGPDPQEDAEFARSIEARSGRAETSPRPRATVVSTESKARLVRGDREPQSDAEVARSTEPKIGPPEKNKAGCCRVCRQENPEHYVFCLGCGSIIPPIGRS